MEYVDAALTLASVPQPPAPAAPHLQTEAEVSHLASALETLAADLPRSIGDWLGAPPADAGAGDNRPATAGHVGTQSAHAAATGDADQLLALMRQDMSAFGSKVGEADLNWRKADASRPMDFFA